MSKNFKGLKKKETVVIKVQDDHELVEQIEHGQSLVELPNHIDTTSYGFDVEELRNGLLTALNRGNDQTKNNEDIR